jgi:hypothetical protein
VSSGSEDCEDDEPSASRSCGGKCPTVSPGKRSIGMQSAHGKFPLLNSRIFKQK